MNSAAAVFASAPEGLGLMAGHGVMVPIVLPLVAGALLILLEQIGSRWVRPLSLLATLLLVTTCAALFVQAQGGGVQAYLVGNWQAPFGIALALDRLSALMLLLTSGVALAALLYATAGDDRRGQHFHSLFQIQLMGLNGAFLTADLFNLFVFFEVLLAASYGLLLHGQGAGRRQRVKASVHYVVFNLTGSALFLVAVSLLYALTGTLNMADLAVKIPQLAAENQRLAQAAALILLVVFAVKAALLPLYFWLPDTYSSATAPVAALFAILTKVGVYCIARTTVLIFGAGTGGLLDGLAQPMLPALALATLVLAAIGALAAPRLRALVAYLVVGSAGTLMLAIGLGTPGTVAAGLFYLVPSTLVAVFFFLLADRVLAARGGVASGCDTLDARALAPGTWAPLALMFLAAAIAAAGVPPLAGFLGKAMLLQAAGTTAMASWVVAIVLTSSLALMVALARAGATLFWEGGAAVTPGSRPVAAASTEPAEPASARWARGIALAIPAAAVLALTIQAGSLAATTRAAAEQLFERRSYIAAVLGARPVPPAWDVRKEMRERGELK